MLQSFINSVSTTLIESVVSGITILENHNYQHSRYYLNRISRVQSSKLLIFYIRLKWLSHWCEGRIQHILSVPDGGREKVS